MKYIGPRPWKDWLEESINTLFDNVDNEGFRKLKKDTPEEIKQEYEKYKSKIKQYRSEGILC